MLYVGQVHLSFRDVLSILSPLFYFDGNNVVGWLVVLGLTAL